MTGSDNDGALFFLIQICRVEQYVLMHMIKHEHMSA